MDVAAMNERVLFQRCEAVSDKIGNRRNVWAAYFSCFSTISDSQGKSSGEEYAAGQTTDYADISFTVRFCKKMSVVTSTGYRVLWRGEIYNIVKIDHLNMKKHALKFRCEKVRD